MRKYYRRNPIPMLLVCWLAFNVAKAQIPAPAGPLEYDPHCAQLPAGLRYRYINSSQTHDFSGNWDFDGDGVADSFFMVGNGGAHLMFYPVVQLSRNGRRDVFEWFSVDFPCPYSAAALDTVEQRGRFPELVVSDFVQGGRTDIHLRVDERYRRYWPRRFRVRGTEAGRVVLRYRAGRMRVARIR